MFRLIVYLKFWLLVYCVSASKLSANPEGFEKINSMVVRIESTPSQEQNPKVGFAFFRDQTKTKISNQSVRASGLILNSKGHILTNAHVVKHAASIDIYFPGIRKNQPAKIVYLDEDLDLALLSTKLPYPITKLSWANLSDLNVGERVYAVGHPYGYEHTLASGIISSVNRKLVIHTKTLRMVQTDTPQYPGNSGGPLFNDDMQLIGINTAVREDAATLSFTLPHSYILEFLNQAQRQVFLGIKVKHREKTSGLPIVTVLSGSPAEKIGLKAGDILMRIGDRNIYRHSDIINELSKRQIFERTTISVYRSGFGMKSLQVRFEPRLRFALSDQEKKQFF